MNLQDWLNARNELKGATAPILSVTNFTLENMEVGAELPTSPLPFFPFSHAFHPTTHAGRKSAR